MFQGPRIRKCFIATCKRCRREIPAGVKEFPFQPVVVECPLCGEIRRYLPSELMLGKPHPLVGRRPAIPARAAGD